ncbi:MAG: hypothetical protein HY519_04420 [Candidatus Aenigmarchaeota archaeon]|nr:hypothetical protein [Candidatus Aenigmarchaeota archaeon]
MKAQKVLNSRPIIFVDNRELPSGVVKHLANFDVQVTPQQLEVADYIASERVAIERKTVADFLQSMTDQRLFSQMANLCSSYERSVLMIEGNPEMLFLENGMHENAVRGALASIAIDHKVPIMWTRNTQETAGMIYWIAYREQVLDKKEMAIRSGKKPETLPEMQEYLIAGMPSVSTKLSRNLLGHFKTPKNVFNATPEELQKVELIGKKKAKRIWEILNSEYPASDSQ